MPGVSVGVRVLVGGGVLEGVNVLVGVLEGVNVGVRVGVLDGVLDGSVAVRVGVLDGVSVRVGVLVIVGVRVIVGVSVRVGVRVGVLVSVGVAVKLFTLPVTGQVPQPGKLKVKVTVYEPTKVSLLKSASQVANVPPPLSRMDGAGAFTGEVVLSVSKY